MSLNAAICEDDEAQVKQIAEYLRLLPDECQIEQIIAFSAGETLLREVEEGTTFGVYLLDIDLPGFKKDEVNVQLEDGYLTVSAAKGLDKDEKKKGRYIRQERYAGQCSRSFYVGESVQPKDVHAKFEDGILKLSLPKAEQPKLPDHRTITIE